MHKLNWMQEFRNYAQIKLKIKKLYDNASINQLMKKLILIFFS